MAVDQVRVRATAGAGAGAGAGARTGVNPEAGAGAGAGACQKCYGYCGGQAPQKPSETDFRTATNACAATPRDPATAAPAKKPFSNTIRRPRRNLDSKTRAESRRQSSNNSWGTRKPKTNKVRA